MLTVEISIEEYNRLISDVVFLTKQVANRDKAIKILKVAINLGIKYKERGKL